MKPDAADVIARGVRKGGRPSLSDIANELEDWARGINSQVPTLARWMYLLAHELTARHDHADPCDDCVCFQAGRDYARDNIEPPCKR